VRIPALAFASFLLASFLSPVVYAHEPKEYTILLTQEGSTPQTIPDDVLVQTDFLFFMNVDDREGVSHRIQFDTDGDGIFNGTDDFSTNWLSGSCDLNENGTKVEESCLVAQPILLGPENGLLPGTIQLRHQISQNSTLLEYNMSVTFNQDIHSEPSLQIESPITEQNNSKDSSDIALIVILVGSILGIIGISRIMFTPKQEFIGKYDRK